MPKPIDEILIYEIIDKKAIPLRYKIQRGAENFGTFFCFVASSNSIRLGYPFEILFWALPQLLNTSYKNRNTLEVSSKVLDGLPEKILPGHLFDSDKVLEKKLMERYRQKFPEAYQRHFG